MRNGNPRVLVLFYGGTVGQQWEGEGDTRKLVVPQDEDGRVFQYRAVHGFLTKIANSSPEWGDRLIWRQVVTLKDSNNLTLEDRIRLFKFLDIVQNPLRVLHYQEKENEPDRRVRKFAAQYCDDTRRRDGPGHFDGVQIIVGTDRLAEEAAAVCLAHFAKFRLTRQRKAVPAPNIPVCITGAQAPAIEEWGDARPNIIRGWMVLKALCQMGKSAILVNFDKRVMLAGQVWKAHPTAFDAFDSQRGAQVGEINGAGVSFWGQELPAKPKEPRELKFTWASNEGVCVRELRHHMPPDELLHTAQDEKCTALLLKPSGPGNACDRGEYSVVPIIEHIGKKLKRPCFLLLPAASAGATVYEPGEALRRVTIPATGMTETAAALKIAWLQEHGGSIRGIRSWTARLRQNLAGLVAQSDRLAHVHS